MRFVFVTVDQFRWIWGKSQPQARIGLEAIPNSLRILGTNVVIIPTGVIELGSLETRGEFENLKKLYEMIDHEEFDIVQLQRLGA